jgi:hypothetical protein
MKRHTNDAASPEMVEISDIGKEYRYLTYDCIPPSLLIYL